MISVDVAVKRTIKLCYFMRRAMASQRQFLFLVPCPFLFVPRSFPFFQPFPCSFLLFYSFVLFLFLALIPSPCPLLFLFYVPFSFSLSCFHVPFLVLFFASVLFRVPASDVAVNSIQVFFY